MTCQIFSMPLGDLDTNSYLILDTQAKKAVIVDPAEGCSVLIKKSIELGCELSEVWITHAHFDHLTGISEIIMQHPVPIYLNPKDLALYKAKGGSALFGFKVAPLPDPMPILKENLSLSVGKCVGKVYEIPGHSPGHVVFYFEELNAVICGDVIFYHAIGRTDLPGGDYDMLITNIRTKLMSLPPNTRLLPGHGPETTVGEELRGNPYLLNL